MLKDPYRIVAFDDSLVVNISTICFLLGEKVKFSNVLHFEHFFIENKNALYAVSEKGRKIKGEKLERDQTGSDV